MLREETHSYMRLRDVPNGRHGACTPRARRDEQYSVQLTTTNREGAALVLQSGGNLLVDGFIMKPFNSGNLKLKLREITSPPQERRSVRLRHE